MSKAYRVSKRTVMFDKQNPKTVFSVQPVSYGLLTTDESGRPKDTRTLAQRSALVRLLKALKQQFPQALIRGHNEMPGATTKSCPCFKPSKELSFLDTSPFFQST